MSRLSYTDGRFFFTSEKQKDVARAESAGLRYEEATLRWVTRSCKKARALRGFADSSAERKLKSYFITDLAAPEFISYPDHQSPRTWQIASAWWMLSRTPVLCADEAGMGKTISAILAMNSSPGPAIITCPPYLKYNWLKELEQWSTCDVVSLVESADDDFNADILVIPDSMISNGRIHARLSKRKFKWLIIDESQRFKTGDTNRTRTMFGGEKENERTDAITGFAERVVLLSGTPIPNGRPIELYPVLDRLAPEAVSHRDSEAYWREFCGGRSVTRHERGRPIVNRDYSGASNLKRLNRELREKFMIRHEKADHLHELGSKTRQLIFLDAPLKTVLLEKELLRDISIDELLDKRVVGQKVESLGEIAKYRKEVGLAKLKPSIEYIRDLLESSGEKVIVSAYHIEVVEQLHVALKDFGALKIRGGMSAKEKQKAVESFQTKAKHRVCVGNTLAMGLGNTMTAAPFLVSVEPEWTPGVNEQMEDRIHRMSQTKHVYCRYLVLRDSLDERMLRRALDKEENIRTVMKETKA